MRTLLATVMSVALVGGASADKIESGIGFVSPSLAKFSNSYAELLSLTNKQKFRFATNAKKKNIVSYFTRILLIGSAIAVGIHQKEKSHEEVNVRSNLFDNFRIKCRRLQLHLFRGKRRWVKNVLFRLESRHELY